MIKKFESMGLMLDCSRNAVMNIESLKKLIDLMNIMGYDSLQLYTEDTYEVEGEPYFGYQRGRYTIKEIQELDAYAKTKNVKLIPCIQTLAHLNSIFRWNVYNSVNDIEDILLIDEPRTYQLIENMFASLRKAYSSKMIHIGMDEAWQLGRGAYYTIHGDYNRSEILMRHLHKVCDIARKYGFKPMIWSDMFIREAKSIPNYDFEENKKQINELADLVYWNYYTTDKKVYDNDIDFHHRLCDNTWFAGGLWCWGGFAPFNEYSMKISASAIKSCLEKDVKNVFFTMWGDNGAECSVFSLLPSLFYVSCVAKGIEDIKVIKAKFKETFNLNFDDFMLLDSPNNLVKDHARENPCKYMLYNDAFLGSFDTSVAGKEGLIYRDNAKKLLEAKKHAKEYAYLFDYLAKLCSVLEIKYELGVKTRKAYQNNDRKMLAELVLQYKETAKRVKAFYKSFRTVWEKENKPYGFEVQDARLGGLILRLENLARRLKLYCDNKVNELPELDAQLLDYFNSDGKKPTYHNIYREMTSTSVM